MDIHRLSVRTLAGAQQTHVVGMTSRLRHFDVIFPLGIWQVEGLHTEGYFFHFACLPDKELCTGGHAHF